MNKKQVIETRLIKNDGLLPSKDVTLNGADRAFIIRAITRVPPSARTRQERELLDKVAR